MEKKNPFKTITVCESMYYGPLSRNEMIRNLWAAGIIVGLVLFACGFKMLMIPIGLTASPAPAYAPYLFFIGFSLMGLSFLGFVTNLTAAPDKKDETKN